MRYVANLIILESIHNVLLTYRIAQVFVLHILNVYIFFIKLKLNQGANQKWNKKYCQLNRT